jgi:uncharacterized protein YbjT (DUF2867 family)
MKEALSKDPRPILVIGATGYVGGRLVPRLLDAGYRVRAVARSMAKLASRPWAGHHNLELAAADVQDLEGLKQAAKGCRAAFYLVHSMTSSSKDFVEADRRSARNMVSAAASAGLERIIYLGALGRTIDPCLSKHLRSRHEVAAILQSGPVPTTLLRSAMILGSGSASFEMLRYLVDRMPVMFTPPWVHTPVQPISIRNVLTYLIGCLGRQETAGQSYDIGGPDVLTYAGLIDIYAEEAGLKKRSILPLPFITPRMSAIFIHLVTPIPLSLAQPLVEGLLNRVVCLDTRIQVLIPQRLLDCRETIRRALKKTEEHCVEACWSDAGELHPPEWVHCGDAEYAGGTIMRCGYAMRLQAEPEEVWERIVRIGGVTGWYYGQTLWRIRGWLDKIIGGTTLARGRRHPMSLQVGDALDFWRVLDIAAPYYLLLVSEMKIPGEALLEFSIVPVGKGKTELCQMSRFVPRGMAGLAYWYSLYFPHHWLFRGMLRTIAKAVGKPVLDGPRPFTARVEAACDAEQPNRKRLKKPPFSP